MSEQRATWKTYVFLHAILLLYSLSNVFSKVASTKPFMSLSFILNYGAVLAILLVYAFFWQQILKKMPLVVAFSNKAVTIVWGMIFGLFLFEEAITWYMIVGALIIFVGIYVVVSDDE